MSASMLYLMTLLFSSMALLFCIIFFFSRYAIKDTDSPANIADTIRGSLALIAIRNTHKGKNNIKIRFMKGQKNRHH